jgi:hypothetical protein
MRAVRQPAHLSISAKVSESVGKGTPFILTPAAEGMRLVIMAARLGMHTGEATKQRSNTVPRFASASMFGVRSAVLP